MNPIIIELKPFGQFWQVTRNGDILVCAVDRNGAINTAARLLCPEIRNLDSKHFTLIGLEFSELQQAKSLDPNWKRKGPRIEVELFDQAEVYLQVELLPPEEAALIEAYRAALAEDDFNTALKCLVQLGERQDCSNPFWKVLERLTGPIWPTQWMVDRREKGRREAKIAAIKRRARGLS
jgi:hypothetical protein